MIFGGYHPKHRKAKTEPQHVAAPAPDVDTLEVTVAERIEARRAELRRQDQARFDHDGCPRYALDVALDADAVDLALWETEVRAS